MAVENAAFHAFKTSGKWYTSGRGYLSPDVFKVFGTGDRRRQIVFDNDGKYPGLSGPGDGFILVIVGDEMVNYGYPLMLNVIS